MVMEETLQSRAIHFVRECQDESQNTLFAKVNKGYKDILTIMNSFSKWLGCTFVNKSEHEVTKQMESVLKQQTSENLKLMLLWNFSINILKIFWASIVTTIIKKRKRR